MTSTYSGKYAAGLRSKGKLLLHDWIGVFLFLFLQILNYVVACDHLCQLGYDMIQVEEALEMFQNCETKVNCYTDTFSQQSVIRVNN